MCCGVSNAVKALPIYKNRSDSLFVALPLPLTPQQTHRRNPWADRSPGRTYIGQALLIRVFVSGEIPYFSSFRLHLAIKRDLALRTIPL